MIKLKKLLRQVANIGVDPNLPSTTARKFRATNIVALAVMPICLPFLLFYFYNGQSLAAWVLIGYVSFVALTFPLNRLKLLTVSRIALLFASNISMMSLAVYFGRESGIHYIFVAIATLSMTLFEPRERFWAACCTLLPFVTFFTLELSGALHSPSSTLDKQTIPHLYYGTMLGLLMLVICINGYSWWSNHSAQAKLEERESQLRLGMEIAQMGTWHWDIAKNTGVWSEEIKAIFAVRPEAEIDGFEGFLRSVVEEDQARIREATENCLKTGTTASYRFRIQLASGEIRWVQARCRAVLNSFGAPIRLDGVAMDITREMNALEIVDSQREKMVAASRLSSLGYMAGGIAHEINNPLAIINGKARLLGRLSGEELTKERVNQAAAVIESTSMRISRIIHGLRFLSGDSEKEAPCLYSAQRLLDDTLAICRERFKNHDVQLHLPNAPLTVMSKCRPVQISQVLLNLCSNAFDAIQDLPEKWIRIECIETEEHVQLIVTDSGPGIPKEIRDKIMLPFFTTKEIGKGTGLGLSISRGIAEGHNGSLTINTQSPNTQIILQLPRQDSDEVATQLPKAA